MKPTETKSKVLEALEAHRGENLSGEALADQLHLSRNAVWKAVSELRKEGYSIQALPRKGYCLSLENDLLSAAGIRACLSPAAVPFGALIQVFPTLPSTNRTAKELALAGAEHGTVILADHQTAGRGRLTRSFFSPTGGLYMSLILRPELLPFSQPSFTTAFAGISVCEAIREVTGEQPGIKWVNDLLLGGKKICGILTEGVTSLETGTLDWLVVGIGINIHTRPEDFPPEIRHLAGSVDPDGRFPGIRNRLAAEIISRMVVPDPSWSQSQVLAQYKSRLIMLGKKITVLQGAESWPATALDLDEEGHLIVRKENGEIQSLSSGEIRIRV